MSNINLKQILYDQLDELFLGDITKKGESFETTSSVLQLLPLGQHIYKKDYENPVTLSAYDKGNMGSSENLSLLVNDIPKASIEFSASGNLETLYRQLITGATPSKVVELTDEQKEQYNNAQSVLYEEVTKTIKGKEVTIKENTQSYLDYEDALEEYDDAIEELETAKLDYDLTDSSDQRRWQIAAKKLNRAVSKAQKNLEKYKDVDDALKIIRATCTNAIAAVLADEKDQFKNSEIVSLGSGPSWHICYAYPSNWYENDDMYSHLVIKEEHKKDSKSSKFFNLSADVSLNFGIFSTKDSVDYKKEEKHEESQTDATSISMDVAVVQIKRPWLNESLFTLPNWQINGILRAYYSDGTFLTKDKNNQLKANSGCIPLIPKSFVIVKNVVISGNFTQDNLEFIKQQTELGYDVGIGPFKISGKSSFGDQKEDHAYEADSKSITIDNPQIIGFISSVVPLCPQNE